MNRVRTKRFVAPLRLGEVTSVKADGGLPEGEGSAFFEGYASIFGNKDSYGDVMVKGSFADSLTKDYGANGAGVPCYWGHRFDDPMMNLGSTVEAREDDRGLRVKVALDLRNPYAVQTYRLLQEGRVKQMSFAFDIVDGAYGGKGAEGEDDDNAFYIRKVALHEVSVVPIGANRETFIEAVKDATVNSVENREQGEAPQDDEPQDGAPTEGADVDGAESDSVEAGADIRKNFLGAYKKLLALYPKGHPHG